MSEHSGASTLGAMTLEEPGGEPASPQAPGPLRCGPCSVWHRQQTWMCAVPLVMGFVGLGLSLMLLKWIVVGSVQDYVPTDLVDAKGVGQDPIFLSEPSAPPKRPDTMTTTTKNTATVFVSTTSLAADGTVPAPRTQFGLPSNHSVPHLHNWVGSGTRVTGATTRITRLPPPGGKEVTPHSTTVLRVGGTANGRKDKDPPNSRSGPTSKATSTTSTANSTSKALPPTFPPSPPAKPTGHWKPGRSAKGPATRPHHRYRTLAPTSPSLRSDVFKSCIDDKDLAFCLNEGECSIIETVAGVHRHCRCKEGYHGLRCDQFVPKTDSILSDPTDELGIKFMESRETYQRKVLSIFSIASGICFLGVACMALYRRNKRHREKLRAHFLESRNLRVCSINASGFMSKSSPRPQCGWQLQKCYKSHGFSPPQGCSSLSAGAPTAAPPTLNRALPKGKSFRSSSLSLSPAQKHQDIHHFRTLPISRGPRVAGPAYKHLQVVESTEMEAESLRGFDTGRDGGDDRQRSRFQNMQTLSRSAWKKDWREVPYTRLDRGLKPAPPSHRTRSVPIIPSLQGHGREEGHMDETRQGVSQGGGLAGPGHKPQGPANGSSHTPRPSTTSSSETVLESEARSSHVRPCSVKTVLGLGTSPSHMHHGSSETPVGPGGSFQHSGTAASRSGVPRLNSRNTIIAVTVLESEGKNMRYTPRLLYSCPGSRGPQAGGQREAQGLGEQYAPPPLMDGGANCFLTAVVSRGAGIDYAKTSAS
ncbi:pro-neuregulin-3, membrane-bound isoform [Oncorhynchus kisutch]|uniref:pro-neuregulin-3, membrane-bound isoform n=1 Tax=Oncorhynchus kisutch TaxID=8019 RepID=UPI0012DE4494|nr:pro-neuregulin-3, membrane-bound isoform [Oncorhynchus kisutch]